MRLFHFQISIQSTEILLTAIQIPIWCNCNGSTSKKSAMGLMYKISPSSNKVIELTNTIMLFLFFKEEKTE